MSATQPKSCLRCLISPWGSVAFDCSGVFACSAKTGEGIEEGISWLIRQLKQQDGGSCACEADQAIPCFLQQLPA